MYIMSNNKSPYEIRLDLLQLAQKICSDRKMAEAAQEQMDQGKEVAMLTKAPTTEEVIAEAEKLNNFISKSPNR